MTSHVVNIRIEEPYDREAQIEPESLRRAALSTLSHQHVEEGELTIVVTSDEAVHELNRRHRNVDAPTDVLAFPNEAQEPFVSIAGLPDYLGDVVISLPRARAQAAEAGNELLAELQLLVVHGVLHLLGQDDQTEPERTRMWRAQQSIIKELGLDIHLPD